MFGRKRKVLKSFATLQLPATYLLSTVQKLHVKELSEKSGRPIEVQLPKSWCQKLLVAWATPRYIKVQRGIGTAKCSDQPKLARSPTAPVAKSGLPKAFPKVTAWARKVLKHFPWDLVPPWCIQHRAPKVRRYGNMKKSITATVGILQQSVESTPT